LVRRLKADRAEEELSKLSLGTDLPVLWAFRDILAGLNAENDEARQEVSCIKERLLENVFASRDRPHKGQCAANSISLLNAAGFPLTGHDFHRIHIPKANLQGSWLYGSNLEGANMSGADIRGADLAQVNLDAADLQEVLHGELLNTLQGHTKRVTSVCVTGDGETVVSGSGDEIVRLWRWVTGCVALRTCNQSSLRLLAGGCRISLATQLSQCARSVFLQAGATD